MSAPESLDIERLRAALARLAEEPEWPEVDAERQFSALHGELTAEERRAVVDELVRNPRAAASWRLARELAPESTDAAATTSAHAEAKLTTEAIGRPTGMWTWMSIAAVLLLMVGAAWQLQPWRTEPTPVFRNTDQRRLASLLPANAALSREQPVLRWTAIEGARYRVRVLTPELELLAEAENLPVAEYRLGGEVLQRIPAGGRLLWQVEAHVPGTTAVVSPTFSVAVP